MYRITFSHRGYFEHKAWIKSPLSWRILKVQGCVVRMYVLPVNYCMHFPATLNVIVKPYENLCILSPPLIIDKAGVDQIVDILRDRIIIVQILTLSQYFDIKPIEIRGCFNMLNRFAEIHLETWLNKSNRKPLVLRGARQVGKSTLVREFARKRKKKLIEINLERHLFLDDIFKTLDIDAALREIEALSGIPLSAPDTILFLDEIQSTPHALQLLKNIKDALELLSKAKICHKIYHSHCSGLPLNADIKETVYKLLFMDIGMMNYICGNDWTFLKSFPDHELVNEGAIAEQFIGQHLLSAHVFSPSLNYWVRQAKTSNAEVDYVISHGPLIIPVEVKSGKSGSLKSLQQFTTRKNTPLAVRFDLNPHSIQEVSHQISTGNGMKFANYKLLSLPLYLVEALPNVLDEIRTQIKSVTQA